MLSSLWVVNFARLTRWMRMASGWTPHNRNYSQSHKHALMIYLAAFAGQPNPYITFPISVMLIFVLLPPFHSYFDFSFSPKKKIFSADRSPRTLKTHRVKPFMFKWKNRFMKMMIDLCCHFENVVRFKLWRHYNQFWIRRRLARTIFFLRRAPDTIN